MKIINKNVEMLHCSISNNKNKKAFTLVELIIVITILAILATIAFVGFQNYTKDARDGNRVSTITNIQKGLELYTIKTGKYPNPEDIYASGFININSIDETLFEVGYIKEGIGKMINFSKTPIDPVGENNYYVYGVSYDNKQYQIGATLENLQTSMIIPTTYANSLQAHVSGNYKGIIKKGDIYSNPESLILPASYSGGTNLAQDIHFVTDKGQNLPYKKNQTTTLTGGTTKTTTGIIITKTNWNTLSLSIQTTLGVSPDLVGVMVYGEKEYFSSVKEKGSTGNGVSTPVTPIISWSNGTNIGSVGTYNNGGTNETVMYAGVYDPTGNSPRTLWVAGTENTGTGWKLSNTETSLSTVNSATNGKNNITAIKAIDPTLANHPAAKYCDDLNWAGYTDWYLPASHDSNTGTIENCGSKPGELQFLYCQHKGTESQALLPFASSFYWSSTEVYTGIAGRLIFSNGYWNAKGKDNGNRVRCVRVAD